METIQSINNKIQILEEKKKQILAEEQKKKDKVTSIKVKLSMGTYEIETKIHHLNETYAECEKDCPKGWEIATYPILQELRNTQPETFNLLDTWEFVQNPDKIRKDKGEVARFCAYSGNCSLGCGYYSYGCDSTLGVRYVRRLR